LTKKAELLIKVKIAYPNLRPRRLEVRRPVFVAFLLKTGTTEVSRLAEAGPSVVFLFHLPVKNNETRRC
jgi:hypothetical protein